jgi:putative DNA primase/helicase
MTDRPQVWPPIIRAKANDPCTDLANAIRLARNFGHKLAFVPGLGWMMFDGVWRRNELDARGIAAGIGKIVTEEAAEITEKIKNANSENECETLKKARDALLKWARGSENAGKIDATLRVAEPLLQLEHHHLDADPHLLGCKNGVVDLSTGQLRPLQQSDFITQTTSIDFDPAAKSPLFIRFLTDVFKGEAELIAWWKVFCGYAATACVSEHILPVAFGQGGNGKSTLLGIMQHVLGSYAMSATPGMLIESGSDRHTTELMDMRGARLVVSSESGQDADLNEERVKLLTGGDKIRARAMRQDAIEFSPTHKIILLTNHKPRIKGTDSGIWRRLRLVPFLAAFDASKIDKKMPEKLLAEASGILAWIIEGAREWIANGFPACAVIDEASVQYREESDVLGNFLRDECQLDIQLSTPQKTVYERYQTWAVDNGHFPLSNTMLAKRLVERGTIKREVGTGNAKILRGIGLKNDETDHHANWQNKKESMASRCN